jgi:hypothetical protein
MHRTLAGIPELDQFDSEAARDAAVADLEREARTRGGRQVLIKLSILIPAMTILVLGVHYVWTRVPVLRGLPHFVRTLFVWTLYGIGSVSAFRWVQRARAPRVLREKLLASGVPICRACGYSLRGLPLESGRCPECGRPFDAEVRAILQQPQR